MLKQQKLLQRPYYSLQNWELVPVAEAEEKMVWKSVIVVKPLANLNFEVEDVHTKR